MASKRNEDKGKKITDLGKLKEMCLTSVELDLPDPKTIAPGDIAKQAEIIDVGQKKIQEWTKNLLIKIDQRTTAVSEIENPGQKKIAKKLAYDANTVDLKALGTYLRGEEKDVFYRQAAWFAALEYFLSGNLQTPEELTGTLEKMVGDDYLVKNPDGLLKPYKDGYDFHPDCPLDEPDKAKVKIILIKLRNRVFNNEKADITARGNLSVQDFLDRKPGKIALTIHAEKAKRLGGQIFWRSGGVLLIESDGKAIQPLDATGGIKEAVQEAKKMGAYLYFDSLYQNAPPFIRSLSKEMNEKVQLLWHLLKRGLLRYEIASMATLNQEEFFLGRECGDCFLDFKGNWQTADGKTIANFFFLIRRQEGEENGAKRIRIAKAPSHLDDFFAQCMGKYEEGNKFEDVPQPLRAVLQAAYGQVRDNAEKTAQVTP